MKKQILILLFLIISISSSGQIWRNGTFSEYLKTRGPLTVEGSVLQITKSGDTLKGYVRNDTAFIDCGGCVFIKFTPTASNISGTGVSPRGPQNAILTRHGDTLFGSNFLKHDSITGFFVGDTTLTQGLAVAGYRIVMGDGNGDSNGNTEEWNDTTNGGTVTHQFTHDVYPRFSGAGEQFAKFDNNGELIVGLGGSDSWKTVVDAATGVNLALTGSITVDGVACVDGNRILAAGQSTGSQNGIYISNCHAAWTRATDYDASSEILGSVVYVKQGGSSWGASIWRNLNSSAITVGSTTITNSPLQLTINGTPATIGGSTTVTATGTAGGDFSGTYPNPTIANNVIDSLNIVNSALGPITSVKQYGDTFKFYANGFYKGYVVSTGTPGATGATGSAGANGNDGVDAAGTFKFHFVDGAMGIDADPGSNAFVVDDNTNFLSVTNISISETETVGNTDVSGWYVYNFQPGDQIKIVVADVPQIYALYRITNIQHYPGSDNWINIDVDPINTSIGNGYGDMFPHGEICAITVSHEAGKHPVEWTATTSDFSSDILTIADIPADINIIHIDASGQSDLNAIFPGSVPFYEGQEIYFNIINGTSVPFSFNSGAGAPGGLILDAGVSYTISAPDDEEFIKLRYNADLDQWIQVASFRSLVTEKAIQLYNSQNIYGNPFNGTAALAQIIASTYGGTGNGFSKFSGASSTEKTYTLPNANATIQTDLDSTANQDFTLMAYQALGSSIKAQTVGTNLTTLTTAAALATGTMKFCSIWIPKTVTITGVKWIQTTAGNAIELGAGYNGIQLFSYSAGTLTAIDSTGANDTLIWDQTANTWGTRAFTSTHVLTAGLYFVGAVWNRTSQTTAPAVGANQVSTSGQSFNGDFTNNAKLHFQKSSTTTSLSSLPMVTAGVGTSNTVVYFALY